MGGEPGDLLVVALAAGADDGSAWVAGRSVPGVGLDDLVALGGRRAVLVVGPVVVGRVFAGDVVPGVRQGRAHVVHVVVGVELDGVLRDGDGRRLVVQGIAAQRLDQVVEHRRSGTGQQLAKPRVALSVREEVREHHAVDLGLPGPDAAALEGAAGRALVLGQRQARGDGEPIVFLWGVDDLHIDLSLSHGLPPCSTQRISHCG